ncbi:MAG TPA: helix-turn-helix domain-containing protein [Terriglobus sp.]
MQTEAADSIEEDIDTPLEDDARWQLVQRIVRSRTMQRASHLKKILLFVAESSLLHPDMLIREQDIAQRVLGRKDDFDPAYDTIVRVQIGHLRQKLQGYFENEGASEPLRLTLPRGSYRTVFEEAVQAPSATEEPVPIATESVLIDPSSSPAESKRLPWRWVGFAAILLCAIAASLFWWRSHRVAATEASSIANRMFPYLAKGGKVSVVLPDTSLLLIQKTFYTDIPVEVYSQSGNRSAFNSQAEDQKFNQLLSLLGRVRTTTLDEASVGTDFLQALTRSGMQAELRYARDLHIRDFGQGSYILIGNQRSDPWVSLFAGRSNFQYTGKPAGHSYAFHNVNPLKGEQAEYAPVEGDVESTNYADVTLTPNLTDSGYVLTIVGSDVPANEAAARFLMGDELPPDLQAILKKGALRSFELLLRGHHLHGESNDKLAIVAYRVTNR